MHIEKTPSGQVRARARYRDDDGQVCRVSAVGSTQKAAERKLKEQLARRTSRTNYHEITSDSSFKQLVDLWLEDLDLMDKLAPSTRTLYERNMRRLVLRVFEHYALREISVGRVDRFLEAPAASKSYSTAKQAKTVLSLAFGLTVRYDALRENPVRETPKLRKPPSQAMALTLDRVEAIRQIMRAWRRAPGPSGPPAGWPVEQIIEVMLGTSARIGEALAIRKCDVDVTVVSITRRRGGRGPCRSRASPPRSSVSDWWCCKTGPGEHLLFFSRNHTPLTTNNIRRRLRAVLAEAGIEGVTPHSFRRAVATVLDRASGPDLAAELLGQTPSKIAMEHYIEPDEAVDPITAEILESLAPRQEDVTTSWRFGCYTWFR